MRSTVSSLPWKPRVLLSTAWCVHSNCGPTPRFAVTLQVGPKAPLLYLERIRMAGAMPLALDYAWLPGDLARDLLDADFTHTALYIELEQRCGIRLTGGREDVTAVVPDREDAAALELDSKTAALSIRRLGCMNSRPVELRHTVVRGDRFHRLGHVLTERGLSLRAGHAAARPVSTH